MWSGDDDDTHISTQFCTQLENSRKHFATNQIEKPQCAAYLSSFRNVSNFDVTRHHTHVSSRYYGPAFHTEYRLIVKNVSSRVTWKVCMERFFFIVSSPCDSTSIEQNHVQKVCERVYV